MSDKGGVNRLNLTFYLKQILIKRKILILLIIQSIIYSFFLINFFTLVFFKGNFINHYKRYYPIDTGGYIQVSTMGNAASVETQKKPRDELFNYIMNNKELSGCFIYTTDMVPQEYFGIDYSKYYQKFKAASDMSMRSIYYVKIDEVYYNRFIKPYTIGQGFSPSDFKENKDTIPLILGSNFKGHYKIGDIIKSQDNKTNLKVMGFLNENVLILNGPNPVDGSESLEGSFLVPLNRVELSDPYQLLKVFEHLGFEVKNSTNFDVASKNFSEKASELGLSCNIANFKDEFYKFLSEVDGQIKFDLLRIGILTILSMGVLTLSFLYLINTSKRDIGIFYATGASAKDIVCSILFELACIVLCAYLISIPLYILVSKRIIVYFMNDFNIRNILSAGVAFLVIGLLSVIIPIDKIAKMKPRELIGGFRE